jgi:hypothetical protein
MFEPSLLELAVFAPSDSIVIDYIAETKSSWSKGKYWLGGQIPMNPNDKITDALIQKVQKINDNSDDYACNSAEMASIWRAKRQFTEIKNLVQRYIADAKERLLVELNKTTLNPDVNGVIVSMCG